MSTELRAAAERLRTGFADVTKPGSLAIGRMYDDARLIAEAWLAEHRADDDEAITEEWLLSIGFGNPTINGYSLLIPGDGDPVEMFIDYEGGVALLQSNNDDHVLITSTLYKTRGQLRLLCRALGIQLSESP